MVDSMDDLTPKPAIGLPLLVSAGHTLMHPATFMQVSVLRLSLLKRYSVAPEELTRIRPRLLLRSRTLVALALALGAPPWALAIAETLATEARAAIRAMNVRFTGNPPYSIRWDLRGSGGSEIGMASQTRRRSRRDLPTPPPGPPRPGLISGVAVYEQFSEPVHDLLVIASRQAREEGRSEVELRDLLHALMPLLVALEVDERMLENAILRIGADEPGSPGPI